MKKFRQILTLVVGYFFVLLFCYAASSKLLDFENFQVQLAQSPLLSAYAGVISYTVIIFEFIFAILLCVKTTRLVGLYLSLGIMVSFTIYIYLILNYSDFIPCSCGGILEKLGWTEHLIFNMAFVVAAIVCISILEKDSSQSIFSIALRISVMTVLSSGIVIVLFLSSENIIKKENNFTRRFLMHPVIDDKVIDLGINSYYFAGFEDDKIYLGNLTAPLILTKIDTSLVGRSEMRVQLDNSDHKFRNLQLQVKSHHYYLYDGSVPILYRGSIQDSLARTISYRDAYFTQLVAIDSSRFAIRTQSHKDRQYTLGSLDLMKTPKVKLTPTALEKQIDGVFDSDGKLVPIGGSESLLYIYSYRNQFMVLDDQLNVTRKLNTIDTTSRAQIQTKVLSDGRHKMIAPPMIVNKTATAHNDLLFNQSNLVGKHESLKAWKKSAIIDVYRTDKKEYVGSFYVPNRKENSISDILATEKYLYVLIGNEIIRYKFRTILKDPKPGEAENL